MEKIEVALLGATGLVGQKVIALLAEHERFEIVEVAASPKRLGRTLGQEMIWRESCPLCPKIAKLTLKESHLVQAPFVISALPAAIARQVEPQLANQGATVLTNCSAMRMEPHVPLLIPEVNLEDLNLIHHQMDGAIIANPNCTTTFIALALAPLLKMGIIEYVSIVTMQSISGAGVRGCAAMDIMGNIIPHISQEEEKIVRECRKIFQNLVKVPFGITVHTNRVPVLVGHTVALHIHFLESINLEKVKDCYRERNEWWPNLYHLYDQPDRPQVARDVMTYDQGVHIGRLKMGAKPNILGMIVMGNNLVRGAAGGAIRNLEEVVHRRRLAAC